MNVIGYDQICRVVKERDAEVRAYELGRAGAAAQAEVDAAELARVRGERVDALAERDDAKQLADRFLGQLRAVLDVLGMLDCSCRDPGPLAEAVRERLRDGAVAFKSANEAAQRTHARLYAVLGALGLAGSIGAEPDLLRAQVAAAVSRKANDLADSVLRAVAADLGLSGFVDASSLPRAVSARCAELRKQAEQRSTGAPIPTDVIAAWADGQALALDGGHLRRAVAFLLRKEAT